MTPDIILQRTGIDVRAVEQGDDAWHKLRLGVITASEVHNVIAKPRSGKKWPDMKMSYVHTLLAEVCTGVEVGHFHVRPFLSGAGFCYHIVNF